MTPADLLNCTAFLDRLVGVTGPAVRDIGLLSPNYEQFRLVRSAYPSARIHILTIDDWNIEEPSAFGFGLLVAHNVLHYMKEPARAITHLMQSAPYVWIQDLIDRDRGESGFASDGDAMRYSFTPHFRSSYADAFDLAMFAGQVSDFQDYSAERAHGQSSARHFTAVLTSGALAQDLPARRYDYGIQALRRVRLRSGHLWRALTRPGAWPTPPPPAIQPRPPITRSTGSGHA